MPKCQMPVPMRNLRLGREIYNYLYLYLEISLSGSANLRMAKTILKSNFEI